MNTAVVAGEGCVLQCGNNDIQKRDMRWLYSAPGTMTQQVVYSGYSISSAFLPTRSVSKEIDGRCDFVISLAQKVDAGTYYCEDPVSKRLASSDLIILGRLQNYSIPFNIIFTTPQISKK